MNSDSELTLFGCFTSIIWPWIACGKLLLMASGSVFVVLPVRIIQILFQLVQLT